MSEHTATTPDGRELRGTYAGDAVGWMVHVVGAEDRQVAGRDLLALLVEVLDLGRGQDGPWLGAVMDELAGRDTPLGRRFACPCCGFLTLPHAPTGTYHICAVCFWEDDNVQFNDLDFEGGANGVSLRTARANFERHGVSEPRFSAHVRAPLPAEEPAPLPEP